MEPHIFITRKLSEEGIKQLADRYDIPMWEKAKTAVPYEFLLEEAANVKRINKVF